MEFGLLGPLLVRREAAEVPIPAARQRVVLAALLFRANQVVPMDELAETLWDEGLPPTARATLRNYVKRIRQALGDVDRLRIATRGDGYLIGVAAGELDLARFEALREQASQCARVGRWPEASAALHAALSLWRGQPLADVPSDVLVRRELPRLAELRLQAAEDEIDADLHLGRHGEVVARLRQLAGAEPLRERLYELLMLALYRAGRQADAQEAYRRARAVLVGELGIEPGPGLRELHQRILACDPALAAPADPAAVSAPPPVPRQLPALAAHFAGRSTEIKQLSGLMDEASGGAGTVVISAIGGTAGVGKTALAVHWAHRVAEKFPDGQLYVNLRGFDPSGIPVTPGEAIRGFLGALGVPGERIPAGLAAQAGLYRSLLAGKKMLIVADNARDEAQVRPLLPAGPGTLVLVTSRRRLAGLVAAEGAQAITLDVLSEADAAGLLARRLGAQRLAAEPGPATEIIGLCARLPLALAIAAARAATRPDLPLGVLAGELTDARGRLDVLGTGDTATDVRAVFSWSYRCLSPAAARMFRLLGLHPGPDITVDAAASLAAVPAGRARGLLDELAGAHLLAEHPAGRYACHDLLRAYAGEQARATDSEEQRRAALTGLFDYYLAAVAAAMDALFPGENYRRPQAPAPARPVAPPPAPAAARDWLDAERPCLVSATAYLAADGGWPGHAIALAPILHRYLEAGGHLPDTQTVYATVLRSARLTGDLAAQAESLRNLGLADAWLSHYRQAADRLRSALELYRRLGDGRGQVQTLNNLGIVESRQSRLRPAAGQFQAALTLARESGERLDEAGALTNLGLVEMRQGHYEQAACHQRESLAIFRELGNRRGETVALDNLGEVLCRLGRYQEAEDHHSQALAIYRELGNRRGEAEALQNLGHVSMGRDRYRQAAGLYRQTLAIVRGIADRSIEAEALNSLGEALCGAGLPGQARAYHNDALNLACQTGVRYEQARAHDGLASACHAAGGHGQARRHWQQALALYADLGVPAAGRVSGRLSALGRSRDPAGKPRSREGNG